MEHSPKLANHLGRYRLVTTLGQGGMGTIWLAVAGGLGEFRKLLVIKELRWDLTRNPRFVEMFFDEVKLAARLNHPNVVQTLEAGQEGNRYFLSMEFLDGQPLSEVMQRATMDPSLSLAVRLRILCGALAGLHYAHELRDYDGTELEIVHRDVSPHNIFVTYDGQPKVVDFGIAKAADAESFTQPGVFKGKLAYASPEQIKGAPVDRRADIFAMGVLLWELVTLQRFAKGKPSQVAFDARMAGREPRLSQLDFDVEPLLAEICDRAMHVDPRARFATAEEFRIAIEQYLFVSGERVDTSAIAGIMQTAFAEERATMHRMIDAHLKDAEYSESLVRQLRPVQSDDPTTVADLSELVESSRSDLPTSDGQGSTPGWEQPLRKNGHAVWWAVALVVIAAIAVYAVPRMGAHTAPSAPQADAAPSKATPVATPAPPSQAPAPEPAVPAERAQMAAPAEPAPEPRAAEPAQAQASEGERTTSRSRRSPAQTEDEGDEEGEGGGIMFGFMGVSDDPAERPFAHIDEPDPDQPAESSLRIVPRSEAEPEHELSKSASEDKALQPAPVDVGEDLRRLRREKRRQLDLEDPFK